MGQKVNPHGARVGVIKDWSAKWYATKKDFSNNLVEDHALRKMLKEKLFAAGISHIDIERASNKVEAFTGKAVSLNILEIKQPEADAQLVAEKVAQSLEKRVSFRRAMKQNIGFAMRSGAKGIKMQVSGRLGGAEIARTEGYHEGSIPLQTLRANIDYGFAEASTTYGRIGVKVWIYKGQVLPRAKKAPVKSAEGGK